MAPVYDFRHVELDKIGRGKRIVKPPGGECSDIFGVQNGSSPRQDQITPRKTKNYMQSNIFSPDSPDSAPSNGHHTPTTPPAKMLDTQERLFGASPDEDTPRKIVNRQRSSIFEEEVTDFRPRNTPVRCNPINPITGEPVCKNGTPNGSANGTPNCSPNGIPNGTNGYSNGHSSPESPLNGNCFRVRNPPGGKSSGIF